MSAGGDFNEASMTPAGLLEAVSTGNFRFVRAALKAGISANVRDEAGCTPLMRAAVRGNVPIASLLLGYGAEVNVANDAGDTPLQYSVNACSADMQDLLLLSGADPLAAGSPRHGAMLAARAAARGVTPALSALLGNGVSPDAQEDKMPLLTLAAAGGHAETVAALLKAGTNVHQYDKNGQSALRAAMKAGSLECVNLLLDAGADPHMRSNIPDERTDDYHFSRDCKPEIAAAVDKAYQKFLLIHASLDGDAAKVAELIGKGEPVDTFTFDGVTALTCACNQKHPGVVKLLLEAGANPNLATREGREPLYLSMNKGDTEAVALLLKAGAVPSPIALHSAVGRKQAGIAKALLDHGADPHVTARETKYFPEPADFNITQMGVQPDDYPLHSAIRNGDAETVAVLTKAGARTTIANAAGETPVTLAKDLGNEAVRDLVMERYAQEIDGIADSAIRLGQETAPMKKIKFKAGP